MSKAMRKAKKKAKKAMRKVNAPAREMDRLVSALALLILVVNAVLGDRHCVSSVSAWPNLEIRFEDCESRNTDRDKSPGEQQAEAKQSTDG